MAGVYVFVTVKEVFVGFTHLFNVPEYPNQRSDPITVTAVLFVPDPIVVMVGPVTVIPAAADAAENGATVAPAISNFVKLFPAVPETNTQYSVLLTRCPDR